MWSFEIQIVLSSSLHQTDDMFSVWNPERVIYIADHVFLHIYPFRALLTGHAAKLWH